MSFSRIILVESNAKDARFHTKESKKRVVAQPIKFFEPHLETHGFLRVSRAFRINPNYLETYNSEQEVLTMSNGQIANISRWRKSILKGLMD